MQNVKRQFINCVHKQIKNFARTGTVVRAEKKRAADIIEEYHLVSPRQILDVYQICFDGKPTTIDLHYLMPIDDTNVRIQEVNTDFARDIYKIIRSRCGVQYVK